VEKAGSLLALVDWLEEPAASSTAAVLPLKPARTPSLKEQRDSGSARRAGISASKCTRPQHR